MPIYSDDPTRPSLSAIAKEGHAFSIPWNHVGMGVLSGFESDLLMKEQGPWLLSCPFKIESQKNTMSAILFEDDGSTVNYRDALSSRSESSTTHLSGSLAISVNVPCLSVSVSGKYDKLVLENDNGVQSSRNSSCRVGRVILDEPPQLTDAAIELLQKGGPEEFRKIYGDYYVCGYELGADAGACLSAHTWSKTTKESFELEIKVHVLFWDASHTERIESTQEESTSSMKFCSFNTLDNSNSEFDIHGTNPDTFKGLPINALPPPIVELLRRRMGQERDLHGAIQKSMTSIKTLEQDVRKRVRASELKNGQKLSMQRAAALYKSGIVVELLLAPFGRLSSYLMNVRDIQKLRNMGLEV